MFGLMGQLWGQTDLQSNQSINHALCIHVFPINPLYMSDIISFAVALHPTLQYRICG